MAVRGMLASEFLTLEKREVTSAYDDWSFWSSSENGLKDVKLTQQAGFAFCSENGVKKA